jgi:hypothetical protein
VARYSEKYSGLERKIAHLLVRTAMAIGVVVVAAYPVDWTVWRLRVAFGGGMDTVQVHHYTVAELKNNKEDYYIDGTTAVDCSKSLFPEAGSGACWWVRRHTEDMTKF